MDTLLAQEVKRVEHPIDYLSRSLRGAELNYPSIERHCLMLMFTKQKLRYYLLIHSLTQLGHQVQPVGIPPLLTSHVKTYCPVAL